MPGVTRTDSRITAIGPFAAPPAAAGYQSLEYVAPDTFQFDVNGFGGSRFVPSNRRTPVSTTHDLYITPFATTASGSQGINELQLWARNFGGLLYATVGMLAEDYDGGSLCFFAAGAQVSLIPTGSITLDHLGRIDGISQLGGQTRRLQGSDFLLRMDYGARRGTIEINLVVCDDPFGNLAACPIRPFGKLTGTVALNGNLIGADLQGPDGVTGRLDGRFYSERGLGVGFVFSLSDAAARRAIGAAAGSLTDM